MHALFCCSAKRLLPCPLTLLRRWLRYFAHLSPPAGAVLLLREATSPVCTNVTSTVVTVLRAPFASLAFSRPLALTRECALSPTAGAVLLLRETTSRVRTNATSTVVTVLGTPICFSCVVAVPRAHPTSTVVTALGAPSLSLACSAAARVSPFTDGRRCFGEQGRPQATTEGRKRVHMR